MRGTNVTQLRERLAELSQKLQAFDINLETDFRSLEVAWESLDQAWDGFAYQRFVEDWQGARNMFLQYVQLSSRYESFLQERIEALVRFEQGQL